MLESITRQIFRGHKVAPGAAPRRDLDDVTVRRSALTSFPFLVRLLGAVHPSIRVLVQIKREIELVLAYAMT